MKVMGFERERTEKMRGKKKKKIMNNKRKLESIVGCFFIGKQKIVLFPKYRKNVWKSAGCFK